MHPKTLVALAGTALLALSATASAQTKPRHERRPTAAQYLNEAPPLTVKRRSFLDPGPVVPVGSLTNYVNQSTIFHRSEDQTFAKSLYGNETLPAPLEIPARPQPLIEFSTPRLD